MTFQKSQLKYLHFLVRYTSEQQFFSITPNFGGAYQTQVCVKQNFMVSVFYYILPLVIYIHLYLVNSD